MAKDKPAPKPAPANEPGPARRIRWLDDVADHDYRAAEAYLSLKLDAAAAGDVVLVAGKGHETTIEARGRQMPFDDRIEARYAAARSLDRRRIHVYKGSR